MKSKQAGVTLIGFLFMLVIAGFFAYMAMRLVPSYSEYMGVVKAVTQLSTEDLDGKTPDQVRRNLMRKMDFQYVDENVVSPGDISITRSNGASILRVAYDKQIPFIYNIDFLVHFEKTVQLRGNVGT